VLLTTRCTQERHTDEEARDPIGTNTWQAGGIAIGTTSSVFQSEWVGVLISLWLFLFAAQPKEFFLDALKKLEQRSHKCLELRGEYVQ
jgi:hypothetical protein